MEKSPRRAGPKRLIPIVTAHDLLEHLGAQAAPGCVIPNELSFRRVAIAENGVVPDTLFVCDSVEPSTAEDLVGSGVVAFLSQTPIVAADGSALPTFLHEHPESALVEILRSKQTEDSAKVIGITGSIGKSTVKNMLRHVASAGFQTFASPGNSNKLGSVARHIQQLPPGTEVFIQETGAYEPGAVAASSGALVADAFVLTGIGFNHVGDYGNDKQALLADKLSYDKTSKSGAPGFINMDDPILRGTEYRHPVTWYSAGNPRADYFAQNQAVDDGTLRFEVVESSSGTVTPVVLNTHGAHNVQNAVVAFAVGRWLGLGGDDIAQALEQYRGVGTRQNLVQLGSNRVLVDCYNASEVAIASTADSLKTLHAGPNGHRVLVLGDIDDKLGDYTEEIHRRVGARLASQEGIDLIALYGEHMEYAAMEAAANGRTVFHTTKRTELHDWWDEHVGPSDVVAFKGGQHMALSVTIDRCFGTHFLLSDKDELRRRGRQISQDGLHYRIVLGYGAVLDGFEELQGNVRIGGSIDSVPLRMIGTYALARTDISDVEIVSPVQTLARGSFFRCRKLTSVALPETLRFIGAGAFRDCTALESLTLPSSVTDIRARAFKGCRKLRELHMAADVSYISDDAFAECPELTVYTPVGGMTASLLSGRPDVSVTLV